METSVDTFYHSRVRGYQLGDSVRNYPAARRRLMDIALDVVN